MTKLMFKKTSTIVLIITLCFSTIIGPFSFPKQTHAQAPAVPILEIGPNLVQNTSTNIQTTLTRIKEYVLDQIPWIISKTIIRQITASIVNWINSGFKGNPAFVSNPSQFLLDIGDSVAGNIIAGSDLNFLCSPFALDVRLSLAFNYSSQFKDTISCTLSDVADNIQGFMDGGFTVNGGWETWSQLTQNPANNPYGAYIASQNEIAIRTAKGQSIQLAQLNWGSGFLSWSVCDDTPETLGTNSGNFSQDIQSVGFDDPTGDAWGQDTASTLTDTSNPATGPCKNSHIETPGSVIEGQLENVLGSGVRQLELADSFNEIVGALVGQLVTQVVGATGLLGTTKSASGPSGGRYITDLIAENTPHQEQPTIITNSDGSSQTDTLTSDTNLAYSIGTASQSSNYNDFTASRAKDGSVSGDITTSGAGSVAITAREYSPWWQIDFGSTQPFSNIDIFRETAEGTKTVTATEAVGRYRVFVSNTPFDPNFDPLTPPSGVWATQIRVMPESGSDRITVNTLGRYVRVQRVDGNQVLALAEVKIYKNEPPVITLSGSSTVTTYINQGSGQASYTESGASAIDEKEGSVQVTINNSGLNLGQEGTYKVQYTSTDSGGSSQTIERTVIVRR
jgi:hypothetical protein